MYLVLGHLVVGGFKEVVNHCTKVLILKELGVFTKQSSINMLCLFVTSNCCFAADVQWLRGRRRRWSRRWRRRRIKVQPVLPARKSFTQAVAEPGKSSFIYARWDVQLHDQWLVQSMIKISTQYLAFCFTENGKET